MFTGLSLFRSVAFITQSTFMFYVSFERTLLPISLIILGWGPQPERINAVVVMVLYTLIWSAPFLVVIALTGLPLISHLVRGVHSIRPLFIFLLLSAFIVKLPVYLLHA